MNETISTGTLVPDGNDMKIMTNNGLMTIASNLSATTNSGYITNTVALNSFDLDDFLDARSFNKFTVDHKVAEHEFLKLKETVPTYADEIKENLSKNLARDIIKKATFTKKVDKDADVQHFIGRAWVFTEDELKQLIKDARNA